MSTSQTQLDAPTGAEDQAALLIAIARELVVQPTARIGARLLDQLAGERDQERGLVFCAGRRVELCLRS